MTSADSHIGRARHRQERGVVVTPGRGNRRFHRQRRQREQRMVASETTRLLLRRVRELVSRYG